MTKKITIGIVDDHNLFRKGLIKLLNSDPYIQNVFEAASGEDLINSLQILRESRKSLPDLLLLDLKMPGMNGIECLKILSREFPEIKVIILSMFNDPPYIVHAMKEGANSFLLKESEPAELINAIKTVIETDIYLTEKINLALIKNLKKSKRLKSSQICFQVNLTRTEEAILSYICKGLTNAEIAKKVYKSTRTIEGYRQKLLEKTNTKNTAALVAWAFRNDFAE